MKKNDMPKSVLLALALLTGLVVLLTLWPGDWMYYVTSEEYEIDKFGHFIVYFLLACITACFATSLQTICFAALFWAGVGTGLEGLQYFLPDRWPSFRDLAANYGGVATGTLIGGLVALRMFKMRVKKQDHEPSGTRP